MFGNLPKPGFFVGFDRMTVLRAPKELDNHIWRAFGVIFVFSKKYCLCAFCGGRTLIRMVNQTRKSAKTYKSIQWLSFTGITSHNTITSTVCVDFLQLNSNNSTDLISDLSNVLIKIFFRKNKNHSESSPNMIV